MSFDDFFTSGLRDAERRLPLLRPISREDRQAIFTIAESSTVFRWIDRVITTLTRVAASSVAVHLVRETWSALLTGQRRLALGLVLIVAASVHVSLVAWHEVPASGLWLIVPGLAVSAGLLLVTFASMERREHG